MRQIYAILWVSLFCVIWGVVRLLFEIFGNNDSPSPYNLNGQTLLLVGILCGAVGQVLFRQQARIMDMERALGWRDKRPAAPAGNAPNPQ